MSVLVAVIIFTVSILVSGFFAMLFFKDQARYCGEVDGMADRAMRPYRFKFQQEGYNRGYDKVQRECFAA